MLAVLEGPKRHDGGRAFPSHQMKGRECFIWPHLYPNGLGTYAGPQARNQKPFTNLMAYAEHMLKLDTGVFRRDESWGAVHYRWHKESAIRDRVSAYLDRNEPNMTREEARAACENGSSALVRRMTVHLKDVVGSSSYHYQKQMEAGAIVDTLLYLEQRTPMTFTTQSNAEVYSKYAHLCYEVAHRLRSVGEARLADPDVELTDDWSIRYARLANDPVLFSHVCSMRLDIIGKAYVNVVLLFVLRWSCCTWCCAWCCVWCCAWCSHAHTP